MYALRRREKLELNAAASSAGDLFIPFNLNIEFKVPFKVNIEKLFNIMHMFIKETELFNKTFEYSFGVES